MSAPDALRPSDRRVHRRRNVLTTMAVAATAAATLVGTSAGPAGASSAPVAGQLTSAWQSRVTHQVHVHGWALDKSSPRTSVKVAVYIDGRWRKTISAHFPTRVGHRGGLHGHHTFSATLSWPKAAKKISLVVHNASDSGRRATDHHYLQHRTPKGELIVSIAHRYVGSQYVYGAAGPHSFDCSGYAMFVYRKARVASLPHNSEAQRHAKHMHRVSRSHAQPGDLVFYMSGGSSYHVSIYAGHGMQYSATDPAQGVRHQRISSSNVEFATDWH